VIEVGGPYLYSNIEVYVHMLCGEGQGLGSVDRNHFLVFHIISRTSRHLKNVVVRHIDEISALISLLGIDVSW
jgi:hypothetical protein